MAKKKVSYIARAKNDIHLTTDQLKGIDYELDHHVVNSDGEIIEAIKGADVIITEVVPLSRAVIEQIDTAKGIVSLGHGFNHIDDEAAAEKGVILANCAGYCADEVANHTIMFLLACSRRLLDMHRLVHAGNWTAKTDRSKLPFSPMAHLDGQVLGLVGFGNIGRAVQRRAVAFGLDVVVYDPFVPPWVVQEYRVKTVSSLEELGRVSDYVSMHVPLNKGTRKLASESLFKSMKPTAYFINTCRGPTHDEAALIKALQAKKIAGAALDVFEVEPTPADNPLLKMDNVILSPHSAGTSEHSAVAGRVRLGEEAARILKGTLPMSVANPDVLAKIPARPRGKSS
ncbi:MAG: C-terminal binding protein [SAR202 cluster bacterium]|nr:C-terminal binding protein [SAR202 cluster bacterium]